MNKYHYVLIPILLIIITFGITQKPNLLKTPRLSQAVIFPQPQPGERMLKKPEIPRELVYNYEGASTPFPPVGTVLSNNTGSFIYE